MKVCPQCAFANEERFPACLWCNELLVNVPSTPAADPEHPEHAQRKLDGERHARWHRQWVFAAAVYCVAATLLAVLPGMIRDPTRLFMHFGVAAMVVMAMSLRWAGQHSGMFLHGMLSAFLVYLFGPWQVFIFFMLLGHLLMPNIFWHWTELIDDSNR